MAGKPSLSHLSTALVALLALHAVVIPFFLHIVAGTPRAATVIGHVERFATGTQRSDSWEPMHEAHTYATQSRGGDIYEEIFFHRRVKFQYAPSALLFIIPFSNPGLNLISWCAVWLTIAGTVVLFRGAVQKVQKPAIAPGGRYDLFIASLAVAGLSLTFYPLVKGYTLGQIQVWVDALFALAVWGWYQRWKFSTGVCVGIACLIKPQLAPLALWALLRGEWRFAAGAAAAAVTGLGVSIAAYGLASHLTYLRVLSFISQRGETYYPNQSFNGLLNRWLHNGDNLVFQNFEFSPYHPVVAAGTFLTTLVLFAFAFAVPVIRRRVDPRFDFPIMALTATIASPIAWEHHYAVALPLMAVLVPAILEVAPFGRWTPAPLVLAFLLMGQFVQPMQRLAHTAVNPLQSYTLFGGLLLLATAYAAMFRSTRQPEAIRG